MSQSKRKITVTRLSDIPVITKSTLCSCAGFYRCSFCSGGRSTVLTILVLSILSTVAIPSGLVATAANSFSCRCLCSSGGGCWCFSCSCGGSSGCCGCDCSCCANALTVYNDKLVNCVYQQRLL